MKSDEGILNEPLSWPVNINRRGRVLNRDGPSHSCIVKQLIGELSTDRTTATRLPEIFNNTVGRFEMSFYRPVEQNLT